MAVIPAQNRSAPRPAPVRRLMAKHGLPEPYARLVALLAYGERI